MEFLYDSTTGPLHQSKILSLYYSTPLQNNHLTYYATSKTKACKNSGHASEVGCCCLVGFEVQGVVWSNPDTRRATARYLYIHPTTQQLHQGAEYAGTTRPEESFAKCSSKSQAGLWNARSWVRIPERTFHSLHLQSAIMIVLHNMPILLPVALL